MTATQTEDHEDTPREARLRPRRRRVQGGRPRRLDVRFTDEEWAVITTRSAEAGVTPSRWVAECAVSGGLASGNAQIAADGQGTTATGDLLPVFWMPATERRAWGTELMGLRRLVAGIATNVNQVARVANATGQAPAETAATVAASNRVVGRLDELLTRLGAR